VLPAGGHGRIGHVYVDNLVDGVVLAAASQDAVGEIFTISDGAGIEVGEFFGHYARMLGKAPVRTLPTAVARGIAVAGGMAMKLAGQDTEMSGASVDYLAKPHGHYSIEKARRVLGYEPAVGLDEGMRRCEEWLRQEGIL
jgi:nucleoside-diphosphate-sugar epimerase